MTASKPQSPRIAALQAEIERGNSTALDTFWKNISEQGTPLIEPVEDNGRHSWVTFLWRATEPTENVVVVSALSGPNSYNLKSFLMVNIKGTDVWYKTYRARNDLRTTYRLSVNDPLVPWEEVADEDWQDYSARFRTDPLNSRKYVYPKDPENAEDKGRVYSILELPGAKVQEWVSPRPGVRAGQLEEHHVKSETLNNERRVQVYTPAGYDTDGEAYPVLVLFDGWSYTRYMSATTTLDNLIAAGRIPPMLALFLDSPDRNNELPCNPHFASFLAHELVPWARKLYHISHDASRNVIGGASYGGLAATYAAMRYPQLFGNVLSQSGAFWWKPDSDPEHEWITRQFVSRRKNLPLHFYLDVGLLEKWPSPDNGPDILISNRHMRDVLEAKGYWVHYAEFNGGHDDIWWQGGLADGLISLVGTSA
ncbi:MAG TPA: enterochelin esterase [Chloroflexia bacterium]|nr:enterochelin esterase [Chloroflexia bacterium]